MLGCHPGMGWAFAAKESTYMGFTETSLENSRKHRVLDGNISGDRVRGAEVFRALRPFMAGSSPVDGCMSEKYSVQYLSTPMLRCLGSGIGEPHQHRHLCPDLSGL